MTISDWLREAASRLRMAGIDSAEMEARVLLGFVIGKDRAWIAAHPESILEYQAQLEEVLTKRLSRFPLAYITGTREFYSRNFIVSPSVLIPRQETEHLVESALDILPNGAAVLDLGTGSGCVGITLKLERPDLLVTCSDVSDEALMVAKHNADRLRADITFIQSNLFDQMVTQRFDAIVTNPPYVETGSILEPEVGEFEPKSALFAGEDGMDFYRRLEAEASAHLNPAGFLLTEFGAGQLVRLQEVFGEKLVRFWNEYSGIPRVARIDLVPAL